MKKMKWADGGEQCNLCANPAVYVGLCKDCHKLPEPRTESKIWNEAIDAAAKFLAEAEECFCTARNGLHTADCLVVANRCMADAMKEALLRR